MFAIRSCEGWSGPLIVFNQHDFKRLQSSVAEEDSASNIFEYRQFTNLKSAAEFLSGAHPSVSLMDQIMVDPGDESNAPTIPYIINPTNTAAADPPAAVGTTTGNANATIAAMSGYHQPVSALAPTKQRSKTKRPRVSAAALTAHRWDERFQELFQYKMKHGHCNVSAKSANDDARKLGEWVRTQRRRKNGTGAKFLKPLSAEEEGKLNAIGFDWRCPSKPEWDARYQQLVKFKQIYGHCQVPRDYADNPSLGLWCVTQRKRKRHKDRMKDHTRNNNTNSNINANRSLELGVEGVEDEDEEDVLVTPGKKPSAMTDEQETKLLMLGFQF